MNPRVQYYRNFIGQEVTTAPSPFSNWLRGTIREVNEDSVTLEFTVRKEMCNPVKMLHGGVMSAIIDDMIGMNIWLVDDTVFYATVSLHVDYYSVAPEGRQILAQTKIVKKGGRVLHAECLLKDTDQKLLAKGSSILVAAD